MPATEHVTVRWWQALDPPIYLISVLPGAAVLLAGVASGRSTVHVVLATLAVILLQHAINVLNDVSDWRLGADAEKLHSWARYHRLDLQLAATHGYASLLAGALLGLAVLIDARQLWLVAVAAPLILLGYLYNSGPRPLAYTHLGEWVTGLCYGPGVFGCLWLLANDSRTLTMVPGSLAFFALAVALLLSHQPPQIETDRQAGKYTFAVRYGADRTRQAARLLYLAFLAGLGAALWLSSPAMPVLLTGVMTGTASALALLLRRPTPRTILSGATLVVIGSLLAAWLQPF